MTQGRFITVLPRTRKEDQQFRQRLLRKPDSIRWNELYTMTKELITKGKAYVCSLSADEVNDYRGSLTKPGKDSPDRDRSPEESVLSVDHA